MSERKRRQCKACPWRKDVVPDRDIPNGYCSTAHAALASTIAKDPASSLDVEAFRMMACHESPVGREAVCVGWLANQLGPGNNIMVRLLARRGRFPAFELVGKQHKTFEDTLPKGG